MLKLFEVTGFKSFKETVRIDFSDVREYKFNSRSLIHTPTKVNTDWVYTHKQEVTA
jgi:hypothetical protein